MLDPRFDSIVYQSEVYVSNLVDQLISQRRLGKALDAKWKKVHLINIYLNALQEKGKLTDSNDITNLTYILDCLCVLCEIASFPTAPTLLWNGPPALIVGAKGDKGDKGDKGNTGATGLATDFLAGPSSTTIVVDTFPITSAKAARWDYIVLENGGAERAGSVVGHWKSDGTATSLYDNADDDTTASTDGIEFDVQATATTVYLIAVITSGTWTINGTRYFIPNNGNGTGPISGLLPNGKIYIGNSINVAQDQTLSGAISLVNNTGVTQINTNYIVDSMINSSAAIQVSKLQALTASKIVVTNASGILSTTSSPTLVELGYVGGVTSAIQTQLNTKITDPTTTIGDLIYRNASNVLTRFPIGSANQVLTVIGGVPTWQNPVAGFSDPMTTVGDIMIRNGSNVTARLGIGSSGQILTVSGGVPVWQTPVVSGGTVTSVAASAPAAGFTISGSPITTSGTFTFTLANDLAAVEGLSSVGIVRRTAPEVWSAGGLIQINEGGTNLSSYTTGDILYASATNILSRLGIGSANQVLKVIAGLPTWGGVPAAGSNTQIQYNSSGVLAADANLTYNGITLTFGPNILSLGNTAGSIQTLNGVPGTSGTPTGSTIVITAGPGYSSGAGAGGNLNLVSGQGFSLTDGDVNINSAPAGGVHPGNTIITAGKVNLALYKELQLNGSSGTSGQYLKSQGAGSPPVWATLAPNFTIASYTPTVTGVQNVTSLTAQTFIYRTNGISVEVFGTVNVRAATSGTWGNVAFTISAPPGYTVTFSNVYDVIGVVGGVFNSSGLGSATTPISGIVEAVTSSTNMQCTFTSTNPANYYTIKIHAIYTLIPV